MRNNIIELLKGVEVEWKALGEVAKITIGEFIHQNNQAESAKYPVYNGGISPTGYYNNFNNRGHKIIVSARGANAGFVNRISKPYWAGNSCYSIGIKDYYKLNWIFIYYFLKENEKNLIGSQQKGSIPSVSKKQMEKLQIPIPPLHVQTEIVRILDKFTALTAELTAELTARKKQYNYYRDKLLTFKEDEVEWKTVEEIFYLKNGYTPSKSESKFWENGDIPWFRMEDIRENGRVLNDALQKINKIAVKGGKLFSENSIIISTSATIGEHALVTVSYLSNQRFTNISLKEEYQDHFDIKFVFYYCFILCNWCKKNTTVSNFSSVDMNGFKKFKFPIPPLKEQARIVEILDKFDALTNSITEGLPREIALRQKQYEYYRNLLLDFPKVQES
ncbi:MAG: restriction endonuclease subunit S [Gilliamella sp.]|uniref:restriction endonuclease subunit S n=1 Tax=Gilliamella sp. TaxID=1891236 RepID=UPI0025EB0CF3|nr:restriction endonuclease subunit S [Gilliamella sp.]MCO6545704.1 restriction endonuclease subunit S [Gilliamella sp.]